MHKLQRFDRSGCLAAAHHKAGDLDLAHLEKTGGLIVEEKWKDILASAITLHRHSGDEQTRVVLKGASIFIQSIGVETFAIALPRGSSLVKSIGRMIKRAARGVKA